MGAESGLGTLPETGERPDRAAVEERLLQNLGLVKSLVRRFTGRGADPEELFQLGMIGLFKAILAFDPSYGTAFSTYAVPKIEGEIRRHLRDRGSAIRVSRAVYERAVLLRKTEGELTQTLGRPPKLSELSEVLSLTPFEIGETELFFRGVDSLDREVSEDGSPLGDLVPDPEGEEKTLERLSLREAVSRLPRREAEVIDLLFARGLTQTQAARILDTSQVQISRIRKKALLSLKKLLSEA
ncbi:MAG: sigma-70 family RNA polymerase sigma factor [Clostridia bacterium]|nr:sigma-70 family RNA polymerase sigma factor [Clostridia bacterium]